MADSVATLSLLMLGVGLLGIAFTVVMALKSKRTQQQLPESRTGRVRLHLAP